MSYFLRFLLSSIIDPINDPIKKNWRTIKKGAVKAIKSCLPNSPKNTAKTIPGRVRKDRIIESNELGLAFQKTTVTIIPNTANFNPSLCQYFSFFHPLCILRLISVTVIFNAYKKAVHFLRFLFSSIIDPINVPIKKYWRIINGGINISVITGVPIKSATIIAGKDNNTRIYERIVSPPENLNNTTIAIPKGVKSNPYFCQYFSFFHPFRILNTIPITIKNAVHFLRFFFSIRSPSSVPIKKNWSTIKGGIKKSIKLYIPKSPKNSARRNAGRVINDRIHERRDSGLAFQKTPVTIIPNNENFNPSLCQYLKPIHLCLISCFMFFIITLIIYKPSENAGKVEK